MLSGVKLLQKKTLLPDSEKIQITIEFSLKMMNQIGNQLCGGTIKLVTSNVRTVMTTSTLKSKMDKLLTPSFLLQSLVFNLKTPLTNATTSTTSTSLTTSREF